MMRPQIMGILNLTPDSFSGDGVMDVSDLLARFDQLVGDGADIIDVGAESTRPGATALSDAQEWSRLEPLLTALQNHPLRSKVKLSVDSYHPQNIARALALGADMANDVTGLRDDAMLAAVAGKGCDIVVMHALSVPVDAAQVLPADCDVVQEILHWKESVTARANSHGIDSSRLIYDPGLGFGKTVVQSLSLVQRADELVHSGGRWLVGHSRKSFLKAMAAGVEAKDRDDATLAVSALLAAAGVQTLRVHAVARHRAMLDVLCS